MMKSEVYNMDCMVGMKQYPDNYWQLAICDPPYGIGIDGQKENIKGKKSDRKGHIKKDWDSKIPTKEYFDELFRVSENQIIWGGNYFVKHLTRGCKGWIVWDKAQHGLTMSDCELAYSSFNNPTRIFVKNRCVLKQEITIHPTQKPVRLYEWLLANYAKKGDKILDTHLGSGSSRIAAYNLNFDFTGYELDSDYVEAAEQRYQAHIKQLRLNLTFNNNDK